MKTYSRREFARTFSCFISNFSLSNLKIFPHLTQYFVLEANTSSTKCNHPGGDSLYFGRREQMAARRFCPRESNRKHFANTSSNGGVSTIGEVYFKK